MRCGILGTITSASCDVYIRNNDLNRTKLKEKIHELLISVQFWFEQFNEIFFFALAQGLIIRSNFIERSNLKLNIFAFSAFGNVLTYM